MTQQIAAHVNRYDGIPMASNEDGTVIRYRFPFAGKALKFRDAMIELGVRILVQPLNPTDMVITL